MYNVNQEVKEVKTNRKERKQGCGLKYRLFLVLKDNRPRFFDYFDIEEIEILPSVFGAYLD